MTTEQKTEELKQEAGVEKSKTSTKEAEQDSKEDSMFSNKLSNRLVITVRWRRRNPALTPFVNRAHKILRSEETMTITGVDKAIPTACALVELLKTQKIAKVTKIATNMNLSPNFGRRDRAVAWGEPVPAIVFHLERGEHAMFVTHFYQRRLIEVFEKSDTKNAGKLEKKTVEQLNLGHLFSSNDEQQQQAKKFLESVNEIDLPGFIRYCSLLIHPLLKDFVFKEKLATLGVGSKENEEE